MDIVADLPADPQPPESVQRAEGLLDHPAVGAQPGAVRGAAAGDQGRDALLPYLLAVLVVVIAAVGEDLLRALRGRPRRPAPAGSPRSGA